MKHKIWSLLLAGAMLLSVFGCGDAESSKRDRDEDDTDTESSEVRETESEDSRAEDSSEMLPVHQSCSRSFENLYKPAVTKVTLALDCPDGAELEGNASIEDMYQIDAFISDVVGLLGAPYEISCTYPLTNATITMQYDPDELGIVAPDELIVLYYADGSSTFDTVQGLQLDEDACTVTVPATAEGYYMLTDGYEWNEVWGNDVETMYGYRDRTQTPYTPGEFDNTIWVNDAGQTLCFYQGCLCFAYYTMPYSVIGDEIYIPGSGGRLYQQQSADNQSIRETFYEEKPFAIATGDGCTYEWDGDKLVLYSFYEYGDAMTFSPYEGTSEGLYGCWISDRTMEYGYPSYEGFIYGDNGSIFGADGITAYTRSDTYFTCEETNYPYTLSADGNSLVITWIDDPEYNWHIETDYSRLPNT